VRVKGVRVPRLIVRFEAAGGAIGDDRAHPGQVAVDPVDPHPVDLEPAAAVDPRAPAAHVGDRGGRIARVELAREPAELGDRERPGRIVVKADVHVGERVGVAPGQRATQHDGDDAFDVAQSLTDPDRQLQRLHRCS
jgi:hypothetical protein